MKSNPYNKEKLQIMSIGSMCGMGIGSLVTFLFPYPFTLIIFLILSISAIFSIKKLNMYS